MISAHQEAMLREISKCTLCPACADRGKQLLAARAEDKGLRDAIRVLLAAKHIREDNPDLSAADVSDLEASAELIAQAALAASPVASREVEKASEDG